MAHHHRRLPAHRLRLHPHRDHALASAAGRRAGGRRAAEGDPLGAQLGRVPRRLAAAVLERRASGREPGTWAVAIDADETLIGNSEQSKAAALGAPGPFEKQWDDWVERREAPALPGARGFLRRVHELGGKVAVVTNRRQRHCPQTAENLRALDLPFDVLLCRGDDRDKRPRWRSVEDGTASPELPPLEIVMWLGDNIHDFPGLDQELRFAGEEAMSEFGERFFVLPNPLYGSWEHNPPE